MPSTITRSSYEGPIRAQLETNQQLGGLCEQQQRIIKQQENFLTENGIFASPRSTDENEEDLVAEASNLDSGIKWSGKLKDLATLSIDGEDIKAIVLTDVTIEN
jgi:hypothetical protein